MTRTIIFTCCAFSVTSLTVAAVSIWAQFRGPEGALVTREEYEHISPSRGTGENWIPFRVHNQVGVK